jgi:hypothetical protein
LLAVLVCIGLIVRDSLVRRRRRPPAGTGGARGERTTGGRLSRHLAPDDLTPPLEPALASFLPRPPAGGGRPGLWRVAVLTAGCGAVVGVVAGWAAGLVTALAVVWCCRRRGARAVLALGAPLWLSLAALWVLVRQWHSRPTPGFTWPTEWRIIHPVGWLAVAFLVATVLVDHAWASAARHAGGPDEQASRGSTAPGDRSTAEVSTGAGEPGEPAATSEPAGGKLAASRFPGPDRSGRGRREGETKPGAP